MNIEDLDKVLLKKGLDFDSSISRDSDILYFKDGFLIAEVRVSIRKSVFGRDRLEVDIFETKNKLKENND